MLIGVDGLLRNKPLYGLAQFGRQWLFRLLDDFANHIDEVTLTLRENK
jgi:hypothetical protein